jgi:hypothetical protein
MRCSWYSNAAFPECSANRVGSRARHSPICRAAIDRIDDRLSQTLLRKALPRLRSCLIEQAAGARRVPAAGRFPLSTGSNPYSLLSVSPTAQDHKIALQSGAGGEFSALKILSLSGAITPPPQPERARCRSSSKEQRAAPRAAGHQRKRDTGEWESWDLFSKYDAHWLIEMTTASAPRLRISPVRFAFKCRITPCSFCNQRSPALAVPIASP